MTDRCPFCAWTDAECLLTTPLVRANWDQFPVSPGHALVVTRQHVADWWAATEDERIALIQAVEQVRALIAERHRPDGYNIGVNVGAAAGQTVPHLHVHVIPRYVGDVADPRGGVRWVIPAKGNYLAESPPEDRADADQPPHDKPLVRGGSADPLLPHLVAHLATATQVDIAVAFVSSGGVLLLLEHLRDVIARGGRVRILTGDYLDVTEPDALRRLLDLGDGLDLRVVETAGSSFHVKSYVCVADGTSGTAFVGSSNLTRTALETGVEWNYRVVTSRDAGGHRAVRVGFEELWNGPSVVPVTEEWIQRYELRREKRPVAPPDEGVQPELAPPIPTPHSVQQEALDALQHTRAEGNSAGLVVLATGLGKTWLAAFDTEQAGASRVLFVAHREEILDQALRTFRIIRPHASLGRYTGTEKAPDADVLFASIQTLSRKPHLTRFAPNHFDYVVVDEFHHASAATYRRLLDHFTPRFLLGLTATPERTDGGDLLALCGENEVYRCDLAEGIRRGLLSQFDYFGVPDDVDYEQIPWKSNRFDEEALTSAVATQRRAENALEQLDRRGGSRTLAFCVSQRHADFMEEFASTRGGLRTAAVHSGPTSHPRALSLERLQRGELNVVFAVDMFNEGVDLPDVDTVLMLRPTESTILWLQQFGRGLRFKEGKRLKVIDYIGNHRSFLLKPRALFGIDGGDADLAQALRLVEEGSLEQFLPPGCSVTYELEAKDILRRLLRQTNEPVDLFYDDFKAQNGERPTSTEVFHANLDPKAVRRAHQSWFQYVRFKRDLSAEQDAAEQQLRSFLTALEVTPMTKSYKMVVLLAMLDEGAVPGAITMDRLAERVSLLARRMALVRTELEQYLDDKAALVAHLEKNPIAAWSGGAGTRPGPFFRYDGGRFETTFDVPAALRPAAADLVRELAEWRLASYIRRASGGAGADRFTCKVSHANGRPMLFLPPRNRIAGIPEGWADVTVDGRPYQANFVKVALNVVHDPDDESGENLLPDILRGWFGPQAGQPGTQQQVQFRREGTGYLMEPASGEAPEGPRRWAAYKRDEAARLFGVEFRGMEGQSGVVERDKLILLFVTLDKSAAPDAHKYEDAFLGPAEFRWQSQNRTRQASDLGRRIAEHVARGIGVQLFVRPAAKFRATRKTQPFYYCGPLTFERWEGEKPITVWWRLEEPVPEALRVELRVPRQPDPAGPR